MPERYRRSPNTKCFVCKKPIYRRPSEIEKNNGRVFCSRTCYGLFCRKEKPCLVCGRPILAGLNKKTCSRACANRYRKGIKYLFNRPKDKVVSYRALKLRLIKKYGKVCLRCNYNKYDILQIHHKDRNRQNNDLNNLELLCPNCHAEEHLINKKQRN